MFQPLRHIRRYAPILFALAVITVAGCASGRLPRIDPTGRQLLIFPDAPAPTFSPLGQSAAPTLSPAAAANLPATPSNVVAPPVHTDPFLPGAGGTTTTDLLGRPTVIGPPVATVTGQPVAGGLVSPTTPGESLRISPSRILAPVGSEVILVGGVCATNGRLRTNERIEWMLDRAGTGQIVTVGNRGELDMFRLIRNTPRKIDNYFAIGSTSPYAMCLDRGTLDPNDDVQIRRGDAWVTVSSPTEGTSYITAYAPEVPNWAGRTARATIYWVDAQWAFPPRVTLAPGENHTLTTTVTRQSDGAPIAGWIVRYRVAGGTARLGDYNQGQTSDVPTNNQGRASVEITPTDDRPGTANIEVEIIRPEQAGTAASPRVTLGNGATSITWADGGISGTPLPVAPPTLEPTPVVPPAEVPPADNCWTPPVTPEPTPVTGTPDLVVRITQRSSGPFRVGSVVEYDVTVLNQGEGIARNVKIVDEFDPGLENDAAAPGELFIKTDTPFDLGPNESQPLPLTFRITQAGRLSHNVTVTADNAVQTSERAFLTVEGTGTGATVPGNSFTEPTLRVTLAGPPRHTVGERAHFRIKVENTGTVPATNVVITNTRDPELRPVGNIRTFDESLYAQTSEIRWTLARIDPGVSEVFDLYFECLQSVPKACTHIEVTADGLREQQIPDKCLEIREKLGGEGPLTAPPLGGTTPPPTAPQGGLAVNISSSAAPQVGSRSIIYVRVQNLTGQLQRNVQLRVLIPPVLRGDFEQVQSTAPSQVAPWGEHGTALLVGPIAELAAGAEYQVVIPVDAINQGQGTIVSDASSDTLQPVDAVEQIDVQPAR